jgi:hypothetical protein
MFRVIFGIIVSLFMISLLRMIMGAISREVGGSGARQQTAQQPRHPNSTPPPAAPAGGELRKCPTCGAYHAHTNIAAKTKTGELMHFCSLPCREKFLA